MPTQKNETTEILRQMLHKMSGCHETTRADLGLTTLSFQSDVNPNRHIWIDTDLDGECVLDLEDWNDSSAWDNSVAHACSDRVALLADVAKAWLEDKSITECKQLRAGIIRWVGK